jgi:hypothetical protein
MTILSKTGRIVMVREPISGRFGMPRLLAALASNSLKVKWDGMSEISVITFNRKKTIAKLIHIDQFGCDVTQRVLNKGKFKIMLESNLIPKDLSRSELERLLMDGTVEGEFQNALAEKILKSS